MACTTHAVMDRIVNGFETVACAVVVARCMTTERGPGMNTGEKVVYLRLQVGLVSLQSAWKPFINEGIGVNVTWNSRNKCLDVIFSTSTFACRVSNSDRPRREGFRKALVNRLESVTK